MALPVLASLPQSGSIVSRWKLDEASGSRSDSVGSNTLTDNNTVTAASGKFGVDAADFEKDNTEYLSITDGSQSGLDFSTAFTFSWWVKIESAVFMGHWGKYDTTGSQRSYSFQHNSSSHALDIALSSTGGSGPWNKGDVVTIGVGEWHHVVWTYSGGNTRSEVYVDGVSKANWSDAPASLFNSTSPFEIGMAADNISFDGLMQDVVAWNVELTDAEVEQLFLAYYTLPATATFPQSGSIVSRWPLVEESGTRVDMVSTNDLTDNNTVAFGTGLSTSGSDFISSADFELDNSEYLSRADNASLSITGDFTFAAWLKFEAIPADGYRGIFSKLTTAGDQRSFGCELAVTASVQAMTLNLYPNGTGTGATADSVTTSFSSGTWAHFAVVYDASAGEVDFYVNGAQVGTTQTGAATSIYDGTAPFILGAWSSTPGDPYDGLMQDAILWSFELSAAEVLSAYNAYFSATGQFMSLNRGFW